MHASPPAPTSPEVADRLVRTLAATVLIEWMAGGAFLPLFPVYLHDHRASTSLLGLVVGSFFLAGLLGQYPAGRLADRTSPRAVLLGGQVLYGVSTLGFLVTTDVHVAILLRFVQGLGAGAAEVACLSIVARVVAPQRRGRAFGTVYGAQLTGTILGPIVGAVIGIHHMDVLFCVTAGLSFASSVPALLQPAFAHLGRRADRAAPLSRLQLQASAKGALLLAAALGLIIGTYDSTWSLLLRSKGAGGLAINLSWVLFSLPFALASKPAGWLADHADRRVLAVVGVVSESLFCLTYPFLHSVAVMLALATVEATVLAGALPAAQSLLTEHVADDAHGRAQAINSTFQMGATTLAAMVGGVLFAISPSTPFVVAASISLLGAVAMAVLWRGVSGRVAHPAPAEP